LAFKDAGPPGRVGGVVIGCYKDIGPLGRMGGMASSCHNLSRNG